MSAPPPSFPEQKTPKNAVVQEAHRVSQSPPSTQENEDEDEFNCLPDNVLVQHLVDMEKRERERFRRAALATKLQQAETHAAALRDELTIMSMPQGQKRKIAEQASLSPPPPAKRKHSPEALHEEPSTITILNAPAHDDDDHGMDSPQSPERTSLTQMVEADQEGMVSQGERKRLIHNFQQQRKNIERFLARVYTVLKKEAAFSSV